MFGYLLLLLGIVLVRGEHSVLIVGIYSECQNETQNITELRMYARRARNEIDYFTVKYVRPVIPTGKENQSLLSVDVRHYDICENKSLLMEIVKNITLDEEYFFQEQNKTSMTS